MSDFLSFLFELFNKEIISLLKGIVKGEVENPQVFSSTEPIFGLINQLIALAICWAGLKYLHDEMDWEIVS